MLPVGVVLEYKHAAYAHQNDEHKPLAVFYYERKKFAHCVSGRAVLLSDKERETVDVLQSHACTLCHAQQWVVGNVELDTDLVD